MAETLLSRIPQDEIQRIKILREELAEVDYYSGLRAAEKQGLFCKECSYAHLVLLKSRSFR